MIEAGDADQHDAAYRFDWGLDGLANLAAHCDVIVVVDVLRFTTAVSAAIEAGATIVPHRWSDDARAAITADRLGAVLAGRREDGGPSLSPTDLLHIGVGTRLVLPSPNGATIALEAERHQVPFVLAGCFRNAAATARRARALAHDGAIGVIAAGERGGEPDRVRFAVEDLLGAGAILHALDPSGSVSTPGGSPEARAARAAFLDARPTLGSELARCHSGRELARIGFADDVETAAALDATDLAAQLVDGEFIGV